MQNAESIYQFMNMNPKIKNLGWADILKEAQKQIQREAWHTMGLASRADYRDRCGIYVFTVGFGV